MIFFFFSSRRRHTRFDCDWSSDVCSSDLDRKIPPSRRRLAYEARSRHLRSIRPNIATPTFVLRGAESIVTSAEGTADLSNGLPNREVQEIKGGSHMLLLEHPEEVAAAVRDFVRRDIVSNA